MTQQEIFQLTERNYECIKALDLIAIELLEHGEILSQNRIDEFETVYSIKYVNIFYELRIACNDTCKSIAWQTERERG